MQEIIPAILTDNFDDFSEQVKKMKNLFSQVQIDIMDGKFVAGKSFTEIDKINDLNSPLAWELHLMVKNPIEELKKWTEVKNIFRVIFHIEIGGDIMKIIEEIKKYGWQAGIALNPDTPTDKILPYLPYMSEILFMTVIPGKQGNEFQRDVIEKIQKFSRLPERPTIAADGGIRENNIVELSNAGVEIFNIGGAITLSENPENEYLKLKKLLKDRLC